MRTASTRPVVSKGDRWALMALMIAGLALAVGSVIAAVVRIVEVLSGRAIEVFAEFAGTPALAPIGVDGADVPVGLDTAVLTVDNLPAASVGAIVIQQVLMVLTVVTVVACLLLLARGVLRERVFSRVNTRLVTVAGITALLGAAVYPFFGNMAANGAFAALSERTFDNVLMTVDLSTLLMLAFVAGLASTVFAVGDRLQRETEGLV
ncbi:MULTISPECIES: hypothetical protein [unclassified Microbacterium]|uniref:hypothetical protein n=1 Tax=unclassified Microbacterium TaxID=2609290 RepID=UPI00214AD53E|nr:MULTISPECIES: hypothetical protein [unclassified Microbacterium]MCR2784741.1 hypothetical protein [Microbacterium sp. zg.B96]WIM16280.1 hypothetical protein QNO11_01225 [Microbacterium sp. zg-B96]